jgi:hypothetical protein
MKGYVVVNERVSATVVAIGPSLNKHLHPGLRELRLIRLN